MIDDFQVTTNYFASYKQRPNKKVLLLRITNTVSEMTTELAGPISNRRMKKAEEKNK